MCKLNSGNLGLVVTTELAARGLDAPILSHVINLDLPTDATVRYIFEPAKTNPARAANHAVPSALFRLVVFSTTRTVLGGLAGLVAPASS
jgi:hypothetical protein